MTYDPRYAKRWRYDRERGIRRMADTKAARVHIEQLAMEGASYRAIADRAGCSVQTVCKIRDGQPNAKPSILRGILAVTYGSLFDRSGAEDFVPNIGARRRVRGLMALGHSADAIGAAAGRDRAFVYNTLHGPGQWHSRERWEAIHRAYEALAMTPGTSAKTRTIALREGYLPPLAWDDEDLDDPNAAPHLGDEDESDEVA